MIIIAIVISLFFIVVIAILCKSYTKDIFELENRVLQLEKRHNQDIKDIKLDITSLEDLTSYTDEKVERRFFDMKNLPQYNEVMTFIMGERKNKTSKEVSDMACKKGRGGKKK